jgi:hypothetical protein
VIRNKNDFKLNSEIHSIITRTMSYIHPLLSRLATYKKKHYFGSKMFSSLPKQIKDLSYSVKLFKSTLKSHLYFHSFCMLEEYFGYNKNQYP